MIEDWLTPWRSCAAILAVALVVGLPARAAAHPSVGEAREASIAGDDLLGLVLEQRRLLEEQALQIEELRRELSEVRELALASRDQLDSPREGPPLATAKQQPRERVAASGGTAQRAPEMAPEVVTAGEFPGSFRIPGTDAALKIGGQVRTTAVRTLDALGSEDRFITSSIPIKGTQAAGKGSRVGYTVAPSRLNFDLRTPSAVGNWRAFIEADFAGAGNAFRLRHGFGQWRSFIVGQTWSTFSDPEAEPDGIDFEGLNAISLFRQPQFRFTHGLGRRTSFALGVESPSPQVTGATGINQAPDLVVRLRYEPESRGEAHPLFDELGHIQGGVVLRQIRAEPPGRPNETTSSFGFGFNLSGRLRAPWLNRSDNLTFAVYAGRGIGRYITDLRAIGGQDGVYDPQTDSIELLPVASGYIGYQHFWSKRLRSTATFGWVWVDNLGIQPDDALHQTHRATANLSWSPIQRLDVVTEVLWGRRLNKDERDGTATQIQLGSRFRF